MVYDYLVTIKNEKGKYVNTISQLICLMSAATFFVQGFKYREKPYVLLIASCIIIAAIAWSRFNVTKPFRIINYSRVLIFTGVIWFYMPFMKWLAVPIIILALLEKSAKMPLEIGVTADRVVLHSLIKREFYWKAFNNVMLKDGMLTLDFKNNRLFQKETVDETNAVEEREFNEYCTRHLTGTVWN